LVTADDDPHLDADVVFALKDELVVPFKKSTDAELAEEYDLPKEFRVLDFDFVLIPE